LLSLPFFALSGVAALCSSIGLLHSASRPVAMPKRSPQAFFDLAEANGHNKLNETVINGDLVVKDLAPSTETTYAYILGLWDE
jgi:hypothetical protein